jgi:hypothetical protein
LPIPDAGLAPGTQIDTEAPPVSPRFRPLRSGDVLEIDMGDGLILFDGNNNLVHHLNPSAAAIWHLCRGELTVEEMGREVADGGGLEVDDILIQIADVVSEFIRAALVKDGSGQSLRNQFGSL